tara:strand:- start:308 stop:733 length:426 start_codon:yes stop_codon:yes gene_type:complete
MIEVIKDNDSRYINDENLVFADHLTYEDALKFNFTAVTAEKAADLTGADVENFTKPGIYRVLKGSRGMIEEIILQEDKLEILSKEEAFKTMSKDVEDKEEIQEIKDYVDEFYIIQIDPEFSGALNFSYTEEDMDIFVKVAA